MMNKNKLPNTVLAITSFRINPAENDKDTYKVEGETDNYEKQKILTDSYKLKQGQKCWCTSLFNYWPCIFARESRESLSLNP
jgi:hypothetical protein